MKNTHKKYTSRQVLLGILLGAALITIIVLAGVSTSNLQTVVAPYGLQPSPGDILPAYPVPSFRPVASPRILYPRFQSPLVFPIVPSARPSATPATQTPTLTPTTLPSAAPTQTPAPPPTEEEVQRRKVAKYGAVWCGPCQKLAQYLKSKNILFQDCDIDEFPICKEQYERPLGRGGFGDGSIPITIVEHADTTLVWLFRGGNEGPAIVKCARKEFPFWPRLDRCPGGKAVPMPLSVDF